ncbi:c2h2-type zinc finger transcription factor [Gigaspora margarita]|uniref:C2h2-type zinc finger transcription factor n=1 Tax=Gigaspora margarita TaxID=4874 RepID=A0A8H4AH93_GIGMA|nr:c2h2-type zinc finger transcription factor [Gigaspora margarita]
MDIPKRYVCWAQHLDFYGVASHINDPLLAFIIKDVLRAKAIIIRTLNLVQQEKTPNLNSFDDSDDNDKVERSNQRKTPPPIALPSTFKTSNTAHTKNLKKKKKNILRLLGGEERSSKTTEIAKETSNQATLLRLLALYLAILKIWMTRFQRTLAVKSNILYVKNALKKSL